MKFKAPVSMEKPTRFCPGCGHGIINRLVAEVLCEMGQQENAIMVGAVGCTCHTVDDTYIGTDIIQAQHGRAAAVAVGVKRCRPAAPVIAYQGDGDALAIGFSETTYAAIRNENITVILVNNHNFGMTGGQMSPATMPGQKTSTCPMGRDVLKTGEPLDIIEMLKTRKVAYLARGSVDGAANIIKTKKYIRNALEAQMNHEGYSMVEILAPCPTNWHMDAVKAMKQVGKNKEYYKTGEFVLRGETERV